MIGRASLVVRQEWRGRFVLVLGGNNGLCLWFADGCSLMVVACDGFVERPSGHEQGGAFGYAYCQVIWLESCVGILLEIENETCVFVESKGQNRAMRLRLGMYRVAIGHVSRVDRGSFAVRSGMFRASIRHVLWRLMWGVDCWLNSLCGKELIFRRLCKMLRIAYMRPKASVLGKNCVDWCIGCCGFSFPDLLVDR